MLHIVVTLYNVVLYSIYIIYKHATREIMRNPYLYMLFLKLHLI